MSARTLEIVGYVGLALLILALVLGLLFIGFAIPAVLLMFGWNLFAPALLGWPALGFWPAFGIVLVGSIIGSRFRSADGRNKSWEQVGEQLGKTLVEFKQQQANRREFDELRAQSRERMERIRRNLDKRL